MSPELQTALVRGVLGALAAAGVAFFAALQAPGATVQVAGFAAGGAFFSVLASRGLGEGLVDQQKAKGPDVPK